MAPGCSPEPSAEARAVVARHGRVLVTTALEAIARGMATKRPPSPVVPAYPEPLRRPWASFVTLHVGGDLAGCIGSAEACRPLIVDVAKNAFAAAFADIRFPPLAPRDLGDLDVEVSVLSPPTPIAFADEADLLGRLVPGRDGLIIAAGDRRALFLPDVWRSLPEPADFLGHLKRKAGLARDAWPEGMRAYRFSTAATSLSELGRVA